MWLVRFASSTSGGSWEQWPFFVLFFCLLLWFYLGWVKKDRIAKLGRSATGTSRDHDAQPLHCSVGCVQLSAVPLLLQRVCFYLFLLERRRD